MDTKSTAPSRRWFRFRLRTMLIVVALVAIPLAWVAKERRQSAFERGLADGLLKEQGFGQIILHGPYDALEWGLNDEPQTWAHGAARQILGDRILALGDGILGPVDPVDLAPIGELTNLQFLDLATAQIGDITPLARLTRLRQLVIRTKVNSLAPLAGLKSLLYLDLTDDDEDSKLTDVSPLAGLTNLEWLYIRNAPIHDLAPMANLRNLKVLALEYSNVSDLTPLANLKSLQELDLSSSEVSDVSPLAKLQELVKLDLFNTKVRDLSPLADLAKVESLHLNSTQVVDVKPLTGLHELKYLWLDSTDVHDVSALAVLTKLQGLSLKATGVAPEQIEALQKALPNCRIEHFQMPVAPE